MTDAERAEMLGRIDTLSDKLDLHTDVDLQAHAEAAESRKEVMALVTETRDSVSGLVEAWEALSGVVKVAKWIGKAAAWVAVMFGVVAAWFAIKR